MGVLQRLVKLEVFMINETVLVVAAQILRIGVLLVVVVLVGIRFWSHETLA